MEVLRQVSGRLLDALLNLESAAKALTLSANEMERAERMDILRDCIRRVQIIRDAEVEAAQFYVRAIQSRRKG